MREHEKIPYDSFAQQAYWGEGMRLPGQSKGLDRWFFQWQWRNTMRAEDEIDSDEPVITESGYYASYVIGAQWFDEEKTMPLVVTTKYGCDRIDFLKMFSVCFNSGIEAKEFSKIYAVDMEQPRIKAPELKGVLSPLIVAHFLSIVKEIVKRGLKKDYVQREDNLKKVKGRIEMVKVSDDFTLMIDYAHNAMALESLLHTLRDYNPGRIVTVFGCGGNRSKTRRYEMGEVSGKLSDFTIITSDNPRFEEPQAIIDDIIVGMKKTDGKYIDICDRKEAIRYAIEHGRPGDVIVLAGKGHETYQEIKGVKYDMDERVLIKEVLEELKGE